MPYTTSIYSLVRDEILVNGKSIVEISKTLNMSTAAIENIAAAVFDMNHALGNSFDMEIRHMIVKEYLNIDRVSTLLGVRASVVRRHLVDMEDENFTCDLPEDYIYKPIEYDNASDRSSESSADSDEDSCASEEAEESEDEEVEVAAKFKLPLPGRFDTKISLYFNHADRDEYDIVTMDRRPKSEEGTYYITYTCDVPNSQSYLTKKTRSVLEADGIRGATDYLKDLLDLLEIDTQTFKSVDIMISMYPTITVSIESLLKKKQTLLRLFEDSLASEKYVL